MDVNTSTAQPTPAQQGVFFDLLKRQTPAWLLESSAQLRHQLYESLKNSYRTRQAALDDLKALKSPEAFCAPLLNLAMSAKLGETFEVEGVVFQHIRSTSSFLGLRKKLVLPIERDLLTAACENFEAHETRADNYHESSLILLPEAITGRPTEVVAIEPHEFAQLCRTLDLGKQYQRHVKTLFGDGTQPGSLQEKFMASARDQFEVARHIAVMKKQVGADVHAMLKLLTDSASPITLGKNTLGLQRLQMFGIKLNGVMFIGPVGEHADDDYRCVVYLPGDPLHPLKEYASFTDFEVELSRRLRTPDYCQFFLRFVALKDRQAFLQGVETQSSISRGTPLPATSRFTLLEGFDLADEVKTDLFKALYAQHAAQVIADARLLVVPTGDEDEKSRLARLETYELIGLNIALLVASFVPVVGEVMFAVAGVQLLQQVYDGIGSWSRGEQEQATDYLFDTLENLLLLAATGAGATAVRRTYKAVRASDFVRGLRAVSVANGATRLWKPDLGAYRQPLRLRRDTSVSDQGLVLRRGRRYVPLDGEGYAVDPLPDSGLWEIKAAGRYSPVLETNGAGAWRHASELPQDWDLLTLFRRLGYRQQQVSDTQALQILAVTGLDEIPLRQLYVERRKPMAALLDTVRRFRADAAVSHFIQQMRTPALASSADADLQLYLLTNLGKWPRGVAVSITNALGKPIAHYGSSTPRRTVTISEELLRNGQFHAKLLDGLKKEERTALLGASTAKHAAQTTLLINQAAEYTERKRLMLFARLVRRNDAPRHDQAQAIRSAFSELPGSVVDELVEHADLGEWQELQAGRVPLRLAEEARRYVQVLRLNRAYEGLYLDAASDPGTHLLVLDTLENLQGWPADVAVQITDWAKSTDDKPQIGPKDAPHKVYIDAYADRFEARDAEEKELARHTGRTRQHFFRTLREGLPEHARKSLGVTTDDGGASLQKKITELALQRREAIASMIGVRALRAGYRSPMGLADPPSEPVILLTAPDPKKSPSPVLVQRASELYPLHSPQQIEHFVLTLGADETLALRALERLRHEYQNLRSTLERWVHRDSHYQDGDGPRLKVPRHSKSRAAQAILRGWRKETERVLHAPQALYRLTLDAQPLGDLPVLVGNFSHIGTLEMNKVGSSAGLNVFLRNFTRLHTLSLTGNRLTRLPQAVADMPDLTHLDLSDNQLYLTSESVTALEHKTNLQTLNLSFNPALGRLPTMTSLRKLRHLALRGSGISLWPAGVSDLPELQSLDLRDNAIVDIPDEAFKARAALSRGTSVDGNPLSSASLEAIANYQKTHGIDLGVITVDYRPVTSPAPAQDPGGARWTSGLPAAEVSQKKQLWVALAACANSGDFFYLLGQLQNTADFNRLPGWMAQRVWKVLEAAGEDDSWRRSLFRMAQLGRVSAEAPARLFSNLEVRVLCFRAMAAARTGTRTLEGELVQLMRGLFRLQQVERQALLDVANRAGSSAISRTQAQELSLVYRVGLAERLALPAQPREINVTLGIEVSPAQLDSAYQAIVKTETPEALLASVDTRGFWYEYLTTTYQERFTAISDSTSQALVQLERQTDLSRAVASQRLKAIMDNDRNLNQQLIRRLTNEALGRHPDLALAESTVWVNDRQEVADE